MGSMGDAGGFDAAQRAIVELPAEASGAVVGAPGTGKTATVVARVVHLVASGLAPDELVVLTPTRQSATALRDRLALAVGVATPGPLAKSVAALAFQVVRAACVHSGAEPPQLLTGPDEDQLVHDLLDGDAADEASGPSRWPDWLPAAVRGTRGFRAEVRAFLAECTTLGIGPGRLATLARARDLPVWSSMASFAREYHRVRDGMRGAHRDAAGLVREAAGLVQTLPPGSPALGGADRLRTILVDDAQELTLGAVELLEACRERGVAVLAFGDPDVGSGAFRGATPENFARLASGVPLHVLDAVHRGTAAQRDLVAEVTSHIGAVGVVAHRRRPSGARADGPVDGSVRALTVRSVGEECDVVARLLRERHIHDGVPWSECAVIAHDSRQVVALEAELAAREVPTRAGGQGMPLGKTAAARDLLRLVELAAGDPAGWDVDAAADALTAGGLDAIELRRLRTALRHGELAAGGERSSAELLVSALTHPIEFDLVDTREARRASRVAGTIAAVRDQLAAGATAHELLWTAWERSGQERSWAAAARGSGPVAERAGRDLDAVVALFQAAKRHGERDDGSTALMFVRGILDSDVAEDRLAAAVPEEVVQVMTPAGALGAEFDTVVIAGVQEGVWPNVRARGSLLETWRLADTDGGGADAVDRRRGALHDELRLFVRAVSRACSRLVVTAVDDDDTGPSALFEFLPEPVTPPGSHPLSLRGLVAQHRRALTDPRASAVDRAQAPGQLALLAAAEVAGADPEEWYGVRPVSSTSPLRDLRREDVRVSPSRLHALEECELNWVLGDLGADPGSSSAGLGTIIHAALETASGSDEAALWAAVDARWGELEFEAPWRDRAERRRARDLVGQLAEYLRDFEASGGRLIGAEPHFEVPIAVADPPDVVRDRDDGVGASPDIVSAAADSTGGVSPAASEEGDDAAGDETPHGAILSGYIDRVELTAEGTVVIVDLKTGKNEPTTDRAVADHPQLAAYQLAFERGAIPEVAGLPSGGAKLLVLRSRGATKTAATPRQPPFDDESRVAFLDRVHGAVTVMRGTAFTAPYEEHCRDEHTYGLCRIHTVGAVSSA